jgi:hypothetical protein
MAQNVIKNKVTNKTQNAKILAYYRIAPKDNIGIEAQKKQILQYAIKIGCTNITLLDKTSVKRDPIAINQCFD